MSKTAWLLLAGVSLKLIVTDKIEADAAFVVEPEGYLTVRGTIRSPAQDHPNGRKTHRTKNFSSMKLFATCSDVMWRSPGHKGKVHIKFTGKAVFGPLTLHDITITGLYSTDRTRQMNCRFPPSSTSLAQQRPNLQSVVR